ncbi:MAG: hypothetical protein DMG78_25835 [Acidobacteria bacterium]|nr:MAG: hypothetical protein DMG78_25835 [Acidobacteriota bacterium]
MDYRGSDGPARGVRLPPKAYLATKSMSEITWQAVSPVEYAWVGSDRSGRPPTVVGPLPDAWARFRLVNPDGVTILFLEADQAPSLVSLSRYPSLPPSGVPAGNSSPAPCSSEVGCSMQRCQRQEKSGECVVISNHALLAQPVTVVFAQWLVPGVPLAVIRRSGPVTHSASWGLVREPS